MGITAKKTIKLIKECDSRRLETLMVEELLGVDCWLSDEIVDSWHKLPSILMSLELDTLLTFSAYGTFRNQIILPTSKYSTYKMSKSKIW